MAPSTVQLLKGSVRFVLARAAKLAPARFVNWNATPPFPERLTPVKFGGVLAMTGVTVTVTPRVLVSALGSEALMLKL